MKLEKRLLTKGPFMAMLFIPFIFVVTWGWVQHPAAALEVEESVIAAINNCRYGAAYVGGREWIDDLRVGTVVDFFVSDGDYGEGVEYLPMIRLKQNQTPDGQRLPSYTVNPPLTEGGLGARIRAQPGRLWLVGNEVDRKIFQDDIMPDLYAEAYHEVYHFIKERDPSAQVAVSGLVRISPGRLQYLDIVWDSYQQKYGTRMPVDVWNMHAYNLAELQANGTDAGASVALGTNPNLALIWGPGLIPAGASVGQINQICGQGNVACIKDEDNLDAFKQQILDMRLWMKVHGEQNKPLILSEYSLLSPYSQEAGGCFLSDEFGQCFTPERVDVFMRETLAYLETAADPTLGYPLDNNRLVQQWIWFPTQVTNDDAVGSSSKLVTNDNSNLTLMGRTYRDYAAYAPNLTSTVVGEAPKSAGAANSPATVTLSMVVRNKGTLSTGSPTTISFRDQFDIQIASTVIDTGLRGCSLYPEQVAVEWENVPAGLHLYNVYINGQFSGSAVVLVAPPYSVHLPLIDTN